MFRGNAGWGRSPAVILRDRMCKNLFYKTQTWHAFLFLIQVWSIYSFVLAYQIWIHPELISVGTCDVHYKQCREISMYTTECCSFVNVCYYTSQETGSSVIKHRVKKDSGFYIFRGPPSLSSPIHTEAPLSGSVKFLEDNKTPLRPALALWWTTSGSNHVNLHHPLTFSLTLHTLSVLCVLSLLGFWTCLYACVCARGIKYLSLTFSLAVHMALCRKQQRGNANLESCNILFLCVCVYLCGCLSACACFLCNRVRIGIHSY